jgi:hypothetical protein
MEAAYRSGKNAVQYQLQLKGNDHGKCSPSQG